MNNPLNELSAVYQNNIAEGDCGCDHKKDDEKKGKMKVKPEMLPQGKTPMGGDGAKPGKNRIGYVEPMGEGYDKPDEKLKTDRAGYRIPKKDADAAKERLLAKAKKKREMKQEDIFSNWREEWEFIGEYNIPNYATGDSEKNIENPKPKTQARSSEKITEKNVKNVIKINPPQGMGECFAEIGGVITEMYEIELDEKIDIEKADMGEVIKDFRKSDAPQFKGKSKKKKQQMAIAAKLEADEESGSVSEETEEEKKKREQMQQKTKDHDDKQSGKVAEAYYGGEEQRKKDEKKKKIDDFMDKAMPKRTFDQMGRETDRRTGKLKEGVLSGVLSTIRSKNGMKDIAVKGKDKLQDKKDKSMSEGSDNPFQVHFDKDGKEYTSKGSKKEADRRAKNRKENNKKYDPYKSRAGESD